MKKSILLSVVSLACLLASQQVSAANLKSIDCKAAYFTSNSCDQCFDGGIINVGSPISGLDDSWTNVSSMPQVIYDTEQVMPSMINLGGSNTVWNKNPQNDANFWKFASDIVWKESNSSTASSTGTGNSAGTGSQTNSTTKSTAKEFYLDKGKIVKFLESVSGANYVLASSDKKTGEPVGIIKYVIKYHDIDEDGNDGQLKTHNECAAYYLGQAPIKIVEKVEKKPTPKEITEVKTGPELYMLFLIALLASILYIRFKSARRS